jgi:deoxyadenosine/deoxycytidine kinase
VLPKPDFTVFIRCGVEEATSRLLERERMNGEAREVPESFVQQYVLELTDRYDDYVAKGLIRPNIIVNDGENTNEVIQRILQAISR